MQKNMNFNFYFNDLFINSISFTKIKVSDDCLQLFNEDDVIVGFVDKKIIKNKLKVLFKSKSKKSIIYIIKL